MSNNIQHVVFEYASTLTAAGNCTGPKPCFGSSLAKGELCFGKVHNLPSAQCLQWRHWGCMTMKLLRDLRQQVPDPSDIEGFQTLKIEDQERIAKAWKLGRIAVEDVSEIIRESLQRKAHRNTTVEEKELPASRIVLDSAILLHEIFEFVEGHKKSLLALALTCKAFQQPALTILWRYLNSIFPVLRLVSNFESADGGNTWFIDGPIRTPDLQRLKNYGTRVRSLLSLQDNAGTKVIDPSVFSIITWALEGSPLFPNLHTLQFYLLTSDENMAALSLMFSSSRLRYLSLTDTASEGGQAFRRSLYFSTFLQQLVYNEVPELASLKLACSPTEGMLNSLTAIEALRVFDLDFVDGEGIIEWDVFESLAHYDLLTSLSIKSGSRFFSDSLSTMSLITLQKLQNLKLFCTFDDTIEFLACFSTPSLTSFSLGFILPESPHTQTFPWNQLFHLLKKCSSGNVRQISVTPRVSHLSEFEWEDPLEEFNSSYPGVPFQEFADALLQFDLNKLSLPFPLLRSLDMDILKDIVDTWPRLRTLELYTASKQTLGTSALDVIAHRLPHLRHLALDIDTSSIGTSTQPDGTPHQLHTLTARLVNWPTTEKSRDSLALVIDTLFPYVSTVYMDSDPETLPMMGVLNSVRQLQRARRHERQRYGIRDELAERVVMYGRYSFEEEDGGQGWR